ncbi:MAG: hypothetical protein WCW66_02025 [Patescibacteria group bacterium]
MLKSLKKFGYPFAAFFIVMAILISFNEFVLNEDTDQNGTVLSAIVKAEDEVVVTPEELVNSYQNDIKSIVSELESAPDSEELSIIEQKLLDEKVPDSYRDLHLKLFGLVNSKKTALNQELSGGNTDEEIQTQLETIKKQYAWLQ